MAIVELQYSTYGLPTTGSGTVPGYPGTLVGCYTAQVWAAQTELAEVLPLVLPLGVHM